MADNHEDKRIVSFETEFDRELATNSNNKKQQVMKTIRLAIVLMQPHTVRRMQQQPAKTKNTCRKRRNSYPELLETEVSGRNDPEIRKRD